MQTTLLGLAIAFIVALFAALIGPYFIDWSQFRAQFETEATRIVGAPVRVDGMLDARILPTPTLRLRSVAVGGATARGKMSADKLDVEFSLGSLMRGEWRASELSLDGFALDFGLDRQGRIEGPVSSGRFNLGSLAIDRLNLVGRASLHDGASGAKVEIDDLKFSGDVRALAGTMRGEGSFTWNGSRASFRVSSGQSADGKGTRVRFIADHGDRLVSADLDGVLSLNALMPQFDGALTFTRSPNAKEVGLPWRASSRIKAGPLSVNIEQIEAIYGPEDRALRLAGTGDMRFGASPLLRVALSARQLDADRLLNDDKSSDDTMLMVAGLRRAMILLPAVSMPVQIELAADQIALGGRPIQNVAAELRSDTKVWTLGKFEMRAPGATRVSASGTVSSAGPSANFLGPIAIESADPITFLTWINGRGDAPSRGQKPVRIRGDASIGPDRIGIDAMKAEMDGGVVEGRIAFLTSADGNRRLDTALKSENFNLDAAVSFVGAIAGPQSGWPDEAKVSLDIARATLVGQDVRPVIAEFTFVRQSISVDRLMIGGASGVSLHGSGSIDRRVGSGKLALTASAPSLGQIGAIMTPFVPSIGGQLKSIPAMAGDARMRLAVDLGKSSNSSRANLRAVLDIDAPQVNGAVIVTAVPSIDAARGLDLVELARTEVRIESKLASEQSSSMLALLGLDRALSAQDGAAQFESTIVGAWRKPLQVRASLIGAGFDGSVQGNADPWSEPTKAELDLIARRADPSVLLNLKPASIATGGMSLSSRLNVLGDVLTLDDLDSVIAGSRVRGQLVVRLGEVAEINGKIGIDKLDLPSAISLVLGASGHPPTEPLGRGIRGSWRGSLSFESLKVGLPGGTELQSFGGVLRSDGESLFLDSAKGSLGGGEMAAIADTRQMPDGALLNLRMQLSDVDVTALRLRGLAMPEGKASIQVSLSSQGRSAAALWGALSGVGSVSLKNGRIAGLDARAFEVAVRASDEGQATDDLNLKSIVEPVLSAGMLNVPTAEIPFTVKEGRLRVATSAVEAPGVRVALYGGYDFVADQIHARVVLAANVVNPATGRPEIRIDMNGTPDSYSRSVEVVSLTSWLAMRSIDRETRKLDRLERGVVPGSESEVSTMSLEDDLPKIDPLPRSEVKIPVRDPRRRATNSKAAAPAATSQVEPLPPAVTVRPAPGATKPLRPRPPVILTPPASGASSF